jgi:L-serine dehydratase
MTGSGGGDQRETERDGIRPPPPSIFNDVIGPVMRGPSSSHCAAAVRIGRLARDLMDGEFEHVLVEFHRDGSLATTHESQGSDMGLFGGLLGWDATDDRLENSDDALWKSGIRVETKITDYAAEYPNTYRMTLSGSSGKRTMTAISTGGGMVRVTEIDGIELSVAGDYHETLVFLSSSGDSVLKYLEERVEADEVRILGEEGHHLIQVKAQRFPDEETLRDLRSRAEVLEIRTLAPVLPVHSRKGLAVPFLSGEELSRYNLGIDLQLWELALRYECTRGDLSPQEVSEKMGRIVRIMRTSIQAGLEGTEHQDRILGPQAGLFQTRLGDGGLLEAGMLNRMILYVTSIMDVKSSMGVVVAAPTAGSCGALPGACFGAADVTGSSEEDVVRAMLAAGLIGVFIVARSTFAAESCGCQAECGAGSGMAAAALVTLAGGTTEQAIGAASMALQNTLGMICDPVANRVEVPCLGRNVMAASNALVCANMALAGFDPVIPLDEVIQTMDDVGRSLPSSLRCTALGGLSVTRTSKTIEGRLVQIRGRRRGPAG